MPKLHDTLLHAKVRCDGPPLNGSPWIVSGDFVFKHRQFFLGRPGHDALGVEHIRVVQITHEIYTQTRNFLC